MDHDLGQRGVGIRRVAQQDQDPAVFGGDHRQHVADQRAEIVAPPMQRVGQRILGLHAHQHRFVAGHVATGSTVVSDGWSGYAKLKDVKHDPKIIGPMAAHVLLPWVHRVFANAKRWALGVYHGLRAGHLQRYLDEFVFRFNRRRTPPAAFASLLGLAITRDHASYQMLIRQT